MGAVQSGAFFSKKLVSVRKISSTSINYSICSRSRSYVISFDKTSRFISSKSYSSLSSCVRWIYSKSKSIWGNSSNSFTTSNSITDFKLVDIRSRSDNKKSRTSKSNTVNSSSSSRWVVTNNLSSFSSTSFNSSSKFISTTSFSSYSNVVRYVSRRISKVCCFKSKSRIVDVSSFVISTRSSSSTTDRDTRNSRIVSVVVRSVR